MVRLRHMAMSSIVGTVLLLGVSAPPASAREWVRQDLKDQVKGCRVTVYEDPGFKGARWSTTNGWAVIGWEFNDKISSIKVRSGIWQFFKDDNFQNQLETLFPGHYDKLRPSSDNAISSFRCVRAT